MAIFRKQPEQDKPNGRAFLPRNPQETAGSPFGPERSAKLPGEDASGLMILAEAQQRKPKIGVKEVQEAASILTKYKDGKSNLENRIVEDEQWYKLRHWEVIRRQRARNHPDEVRPEPTSAWLFNTLMNKHADANDNYPEPNVLPRERGDEADAKTLSSILPVILERNGFEQTYSDNWWEKLKHGTAVYGAFWNPALENGLGDVDIRPIDLLNIFWEPGITDIQKSRNLFIVDLMDTDLLEEMYPQFKGKLGGSVIDVKQYIYDDTVDITDKTLVVDRYYKVRSADGRTVLHYMKFCGDCLLYASENEEEYAFRGYYDHGEYPVVFDTLFPEKGTPVGFGYVAITKDPQLYIDKLSQSVLENAMMCAKPRFFAASSTGINEEEFLDWSKPIIHVEGSSLDDARLKQLVMSPVSNVCVNLMQMKIDELKETASNRDVQSGGTASGVTAAAAIAALQEAGNKSSRDMISAAYRAYTKVNYLCIELIRQFYDETRTFRITGQMPGDYRFVDYSNAGIRDQPTPPDYPGQELEPGYSPRFRRPVFDIKVRAEKRNPFSQLSLNETAKELYGMGAFSPERATESLVMLDMMEFEGKDAVVEQVQQGQTLLNICQQMQAQMAQMAAVIESLTGQAAPDDGQDSGERKESPAGGTSGQPAGGGGQSLGAKANQAQTAAMTPYGERLAKNAAPDLNAVSRRATPQ